MNEHIRNCFPNLGLRKCFIEFLKTYLFKEVFEALERYSITYLKCQYLKPSGECVHSCIPQPSGIHYLLTYGLICWTTDYPESMNLVE